MAVAAVPLFRAWHGSRRRLKLISQTFNLLFGVELACGGIRLFV